VTRYRQFGLSPEKRHVVIQFEIKVEFMALEMKRNSKWLYGRIMVNGVKKAVNLGVEIKGERPSTLREEGDALFERSRGRAQEKLRRLQSEAKQKKAGVEILQVIHEARTGERVGSIPLHADKGHQGMFGAWKSIPRKRSQSDRYVKQIESLFKRFIHFLEQTYPSKNVHEMSDVRSQMAKDFMRSEEDRGVSAKTYNNTLVIVRSAFGLLAKEAAIFENPFERIPTKEEDTVFRKPFSIDELTSILKVANQEKHAFIRPIIYTGICTAMRRGDCCLLSSRSVDFGQRFLKVKTGKTHKIAQIPLFPLLEEELKKYDVDEKNEYFFPEQAKMYLKNPDGITWRVKKVLREVGFYDSEKKGRDVSKVAHIADVHAKREKGLRAASIRDFHSFRVSWVTLALTSGVDLELVRMVTGHKTVEIVLKHYFQPGRDYIKQNLQSKMPGLLMNKVDTTRIKEGDMKKTIQRMIELVSTLEAENGAELKDELLESMEGLLGGLSVAENSHLSKLLRHP